MELMQHKQGKEKRRNKILRANDKCTYSLVDGTRDTLEERWPSTAGVKLRGGLVQRRSAGCAVVYSFVLGLVVLASTRIPT
jgi:hypothetical protein